MNDPKSYAAYHPEKGPTMHQQPASRLHTAALKVTSRERATITTGAIVEDPMGRPAETITISSPCKSYQDMYLAVPELYTFSDERLEEFVAESIASMTIYPLEDNWVLAHALGNELSRLADIKNNHQENQ